MDNSRLVIFDFDGVIVNTFSFAYEINKEQSGITEEDYRKKFEGNFYKAPSAKSERESSRTTSDFFAHYTPKLMESVPETGVLESIKNLSESYILAIVSSTLSNPIHTYLEMVGVRDKFQEILGVDVEKSKVKKINALLKGYDKSSHEVIFVTDTVGDIQEARQCAVESIGVVWGYHSKETLEKASPYEIVNIPQELEVAISKYFR